MMKNSLVITCIMFCLIATSSCINVKPIYYDDDKAVARKTIEQIHQLYNQDDFRAVYDLLTDRLKKEQSREEFVASLKKLKEDNGRFLEKSEIDSQVAPQASFREVRLKYSSKYEKGWCNEGFALFVDGKEAAVDLLMINPADGPVKPKS
ncbi:MAG: hypothetical protein ABIR33_16285 [Pyrinomonadaceae bacterium]